MKKILKIIFIVIMSLLLIYGVFILEESHRLKKEGTTPLIITGGVCNNDNIEKDAHGYIIDCKGLGYRIKREYLLGGMAGNDYTEYRLIKEEFWLFDKYLLWGFVS